MLLFLFAALILTFSQILVTHHVGLVLPGAHYLVRMENGRIETQGTVKDLRAQGDLKDDEAQHTTQEEAEEKPEEIDLAAQATDGDKKPRKLIEDEHREVGGVKFQ
jgi:hypothetical protein